MKDRYRLYLLGAYDLALSFGAIATGIMMLWSNYGIFKEYPKEWLSKLPFHSWVWPGIIIIVLFGLGNIISASAAFRKNISGTGALTVGMGAALLICLALQRVILGEWYLADIYLLIFGAVQIILGSSICFRGRIRTKTILLKGLGGSKNE
jgi:hypothetical protein